MKKLVYTILAAIPLLFYSCVGDEGPVGPQGPEGPEGPQGPPGESGFVFEYENIDFTGPEYDALLNYPNDFEGLISDVALVYLLWGVENVDGEDLEIWRQLPQTVIKENGTLVYNFDFTLQDVRLFLEADFPLEQLTAIDTDDWIARIVVVPGDFWASNRMSEFIDYYDLKEALGLPDLPPHDHVIERRLPK
jgi:hypothetical protein